MTKWLEAAAWQLADPATEDAAGLAARVEELTALLAAAQEDSGYLNSWFQVVKTGQRFADLRWGHELYCAGHLIQAAVAHHRSTGARSLLDIAVRFADHIDATFGPGKPIDGICGHAEIETALVELYRETGERRYPDLAGYFIDRGYGLLNVGDRHGIKPGPTYCQDRVPLREAQHVEGHAVRQLYLLAGATDVATETHEAELPGRGTAVTAPTTISTTTQQVSGGSISVSVPNMNAGAAYQLTITPAGAAADYQHRYEAENASVFRGQSLSSSTASNGGYVGRIDNSGDARTDSYVDFIVNVPTARAYQMTIGYANGTGAAATQGLAYNGGAWSTVNYPPTAGWGTFGATVSQTVSLNAGYNVIRLAKGAPYFAGGTGYAELDHIQLD
ncbi:beta-L-arabinofuranosidase domain-containing protein [Streptomyces sp. NPDC052236]|uniref:beta-L-arabinofuranosidase domain-containing protein n=1 Tax=Streptomyces sp. NPDC052236 TaxID=3365686 RepID=UPI0037D92E19